MERAVRQQSVRLLSQRRNLGDIQKDETLSDYERGYPDAWRGRKEGEKTGNG